MLQNSSITPSHPHHSLHFTFVNKSRNPSRQLSLIPPKKQGGSEEISKKMRNFVGSFGCIDKLKYALRRSFEPQKQRFTLVFSVPGANILNKVKNKQNEA